MSFVIGRGSWLPCILLVACHRGQPGAYRPPAAMIAVTAHERALARTMLELESTPAQLVVSTELLDTVAQAFANLRRVDSVVGRELGDDGLDQVLSEIFISSSSKAESLLRDSVTRCSGAVVAPNGDVKDRSPVALRCWPDLAEALTRFAGARASLRGRRDFLMVIVSVPPPANRYGLSAMLESALARSAIVNSPLPWNPYVLRRDGSTWSLNFSVSIGPCQEVCVGRRDYQYRYDPRTGRAWKESERIVR